MVKEQLIAKVKILIDAYKENLNEEISNFNSLNRLRLKFVDISMFGEIPLLLRFNQTDTKMEVYEIIFSSKKGNKKRKPWVTQEYVKSILDKLCLTVLQEEFSGINNFDDSFDEFWKNLDNPSKNQYVIGYPIVIALTRKETTKIIDITLSTEPANYLASHGFSQNSLGNFCNNVNTVAFAEIEDIDDIGARNKFKILCDEAIGFIKLFFDGDEIYIGNQKNKNEIEESILLVKQSNQDVQIGGSCFSRISGIQEIHINDTSYNKLLQNGLLWLNNWQDHEDKVKADKIKTALYWFKHSIEEINITNKFIYAITVLETILKENDESGEIAVSISERVAYVLTNNREDRIGIYEKFKSFYSLRSKVVHTGLVLNAYQTYYVGQITEYVRIVLIKSIKILSNKSSSYSDFLYDIII